MKKSTNKRLLSAVAKNKSAKTKKLGNKVVKGNKADKIKNAVIAAAKREAIATRKSLRRALYRANKMIASGNSIIKKKLTMKEFKKRYADFGKRTGMLNGETLDENLKIFLYNEISNRTPKQCESSANNLMKHLDDAVNALNESEGNIDKLSNANKKYIKVLEERNALKTKEKNGKTVYSIIKKNVPNKEDLLAVNNKYLQFKRSLINYFGNQDYAEAYGS